MTQDPLTAIVRSLELSGAAFLDAAFTAPWAVVAQVTEEDCRPFGPVPKHVIAYHVMTEGEAVLLVDGRARCRVTAGDVVFLPGNSRCVLASAPGIAPVPADDLLLPPGRDGLVRIHHGGGGAPARMLCGFIACQAAPGALFEALPDLLVIGIEDHATRRWIEASIAMASRQQSAGRMAADAMTAQLTELLLIEALRIHLERTHEGTGWLAGMTDPRIAKALALVHGCLTAPPSVTALASAAGMSRSAFVERFTALMGVSPCRYAVRLRIAAARTLLRDTALGMAEVASRVGYSAPEAFSRAFKRETGLAPADWREADAI